MLRATNKKQIDALIAAYRDYQNALDVVRHGEVQGGDLSQCMKPADLEQLARIVGVPVRVKEGHMGTIYEVYYNNCDFFWFEPYEKEVA